MSALTMEAAGRTHVGLVRRRNEDSFYQGEWLYAVADGLGGHVAGDIASATAIEVLRSVDQHAEPSRLAEILGQGIHRISTVLRQKIRENPDLAGMGTTLVAMLRSGSSAVLANVGDSRAYLLRGRRGVSTPVQVSEDHTYQHLVAHAATVPTLPEKLARFLDGRPDGRSPDLTMLELRPDDRILLCSDGLSSYVPYELICDALRSSEGPASVADALIAAAIDGGGEDNVTVIVADVQA
jgi:serine/threonine protein phosphatase PrpC